MEENRDTPMESMEHETNRERDGECERKSSVQEALSRKLSNRMNTREMYERGIMRVPAEMTMSPQLHARRTELERAKAADVLKRKINSRPDKTDLIRGNILKDTSAHASLQDAQMQLKRRQIEDDLNERMFNRPGPLELVEKHILEDSEMMEMLRSGDVSYRKTSDTTQRRRSSILNPLERMALDAANIPEEDTSLPVDGGEGMDYNVETRVDVKTENSVSPARRRRKGIVEPPVDLSLLTTHFSTDFISSSDNIVSTAADVSVEEKMTAKSLQDSSMPVVNANQMDSSVNMNGDGMSFFMSDEFHLNSSNFMNPISPGLSDARSSSLSNISSPSLMDLPSPGQTNLMSPKLTNFVSKVTGEHLDEDPMEKAIVENTNAKSPAMSVSSQDLSKPSTPATPEVVEVSQGPAVLTVREETGKKKETYRSGKGGASPRPGKRRRNKKPLQWKMHYYNPPSQNPASFSQEKPTTTSVPNSPYQILIQQQQIYMHLQLMFQQMQQTAAAAGVQSNILNSAGNPQQFYKEKVTSKLVSQPNHILPVVTTSSYSSVPVPPPAPPLPTSQITSLPAGQITVPSTIVAANAVGNTHTVIGHVESTDPLKILESFTMPMLKEELKKRGLPVSGNKKELINRLKEYADVVSLAPGMKGKTQPVQPMSLDLSVGSTVLSQSFRDRSASLSSSYRSSLTSSRVDGSLVKSPLEEMRQLEQTVGGWSGQDSRVTQDCRRGSGPARLETYAHVDGHNQQINQAIYTGSQPLSHLPLGVQQRVTNELYSSGPQYVTMEGISTDAIPGSVVQDCNDSALSLTSPPLPPPQRQPGRLTIIPNGVITHRPNSPQSPLQSPRPLRRYVVEVEGLKREYDRQSQLLESQPHGTPPTTLFDFDSNPSSTVNSREQSPRTLSPVAQLGVFPGINGSSSVGIPVTGIHELDQLQAITYGSPNQGSLVGSNPVMINQAAMGSPSELYMGFSPQVGDQLFAGISPCENSPVGSSYLSHMLEVDSGSLHNSHFQSNGPTMLAGGGRSSSLTRTRFQPEGGQTPEQHRSPLMDSTSEPYLPDLDPNMVLSGPFLSPRNSSGPKAGLDWLDCASSLPPFACSDSGLGSHSGGSHGGSNSLLQDSYQPITPQFEFDAVDSEYQHPTELKPSHLLPDYFPATGQVPFGHMGWSSWQG